MSTSNYNTTQKIELATAEGFFAFYNAEHKTSYAVVRVAGDGEVPDVFARDETGTEFNLEITLTEDRPGDIAAALGRSDARSIDSLKQHLAAVRAGTEQPSITSLQDNALPVLLQRIDKKLIKRYGQNTALVIRDSSPLWDWDQVLPAIHVHLTGKTIPFDLGIWLLALDKKSVVQIYAPEG